MSVIPCDSWWTTFRTLKVQQHHESIGYADLRLNIFHVRGLLQGNRGLHVFNSHTREPVNSRTSDQRTLPSARSGTDRLSLADHNVPQFTRRTHSGAQRQLPIVGRDVATAGGARSVQSGRRRRSDAPCLSARGCRAVSVSRVPPLRRLTGRRIVQLSRRTCSRRSTNRPAPRCRLPAARLGAHTSRSGRSGRRVRSQRDARGPRLPASTRRGGHLTLRKGDLDAPPGPSPRARDVRMGNNRPAFPHETLISATEQLQEAFD